MASVFAIKKLRGEFSVYGTFVLMGLFIDVNCCGNAMFERLSITSLQR